MKTIFSKTNFLFNLIAFYAHSCVNLVLSTGKVKRKKKKSIIPASSEGVETVEEERKKKKREIYIEAENDTIVALLSLYIELGRMQELASNGKLP